jgi:hypothetical protein
MHEASESSLYGLMAEFEDAGDLVAAAGAVRRAGYLHYDAYTPAPIEALQEAMDLHQTEVPLCTLIGGITGGSVAFWLEYWISKVNFPINVGGRPLNSWPAFIPVTFELTILFAALTAAFGMFALNGLPRLYHPVFNVPRFDRVTSDGFFLCIEAKDAKFDRVGTRTFLESLRPREVTDVVP